MAGFKIWGLTVGSTKEIDKFQQENYRLHKENEKLSDNFASLEKKYYLETTKVDTTASIFELVRKRDALKSECDGLTDKRTEITKAIDKDKIEQRSLGEKVRHLQNKEDELRNRESATAKQTDALDRERELLAEKSEKLASDKKDLSQLESETKAAFLKLTQNRSEITNFETLNKQLINIKKELEKSEEAKENLNLQVRNIEGKRGELGIITALEFQVSEGLVTRNWIHLFETIYNSESFKGRKQKLALHLVSRLPDSQKEKFSSLASAEFDDSDFNDEEELLLLEIYRLGFGKNESDNSIRKITDLLEELWGQVKFDLSQDAEV